jgi:hypothetical protein
MPTIEAKNLSHDNYKIGVDEGTIKISIINQSKFRKLLLKPYFIVIEGILFALNAALIIAIAVLPFIFHDWSLLLGFVGCLMGWILRAICISSNKSAIRVKRSKIAFIVLGILIPIIIYYFGILSMVSFVFACTLCEFIILYFTGNLLMEIAISNLAKNRDDYYYAVNNGIIETFHHL